MLLKVEILWELFIQMNPLKGIFSAKLVINVEISSFQFA